MGQIQTANADLLEQRHILSKLYFYDEELKVYIDKATDKVSYLERKTYMKKILLASLVFLLAILVIVLLFLKMLGWSIDWFSLLHKYS